MASQTATPTTQSWLDVALTTPWVPSAGCSDIWDFTETAFVTEGTTSTASVFYQDPLDPRFGELCYPGGSSAVQADRHDGLLFQFSPAVCPEGMTMTASGFSAYEHGGGRVSTAYCCSSGFTFDGVTGYDTSGPATNCHSSIVGAFSGPADHGTGSVVTATDALKIHDAWYLAWESSNTPFMTPPPPELKIPGEDHLGLILGLVFGIVALIAAAAVWFVWRRRSKRRRKREAEVHQRAKGKGVAELAVVDTRGSVAAKLSEEVVPEFKSGKGKGKQTQSWSDDDSKGGDMDIDSVRRGAESSLEIEAVATASSSKGKAQARYA